MTASQRRDALLITTAKALRALGYGLLSVALGLHLPAIGLTPLQVGWVLTASLIGSALLTALFVVLADRLGRRRALVISAALMVVSGLLFAIAQRFEILLIIGLLGTISATSGEVGPFETLEQAMLPQTVSAGQRNRAFGWYNSLAAVATSLGALLIAAPDWLGRESGEGYGWAFAVYAGLGAAALLCFTLLSPAVELQRATETTSAPAQRLKPESRRIIFGLAGLFGLDALGGGFILQSLIVYWFGLRFGADAAVLGPVFAVVELIKALSYLAAVQLADRFGLINTMVFTHLPSNVILMCLPLMPTLPLAIGLFLVRNTLSQMDVPTRQSYVVSVVPPEDRTAASGITNLTRQLTRPVSPILAGLAFQVASLGLPFVIAGGLKIIYDLALYASFRRIKPTGESGE